MPAVADSSYRKTWPTTVLLTLCFTLSYMDRHVLSLLVEPIKASLKLSDAQIGLSQGLSFSVFYVLASLPLARWIDRGHRPRIISLCIAIWCSTTMLCGTAQNFWQLMLARIGVASAEAGMPPAALTMMADLNDAKSLARANSTFMLAPYIGGGIALTGGGALYAAAQSWNQLTLLGRVFEPWRLVFVLVGLPGLLAAAAVLLLREPRRADNASGIATLSAHKAISLVELGRFLKQEWRFNGAYMLTISLMIMTLNAVVSWMPAVLMRSHAVSATTAGLKFGPIFFSAGIIGTVIAGAVISRHNRNTVERIFRYMRGCVWLAAPAALFGPLVPSMTLQLALVAVTLFCVSSVNSLSSLPMLLIAPSHIRAQALAFLALVSALVGTGLGPLLVGIISDSIHFTENPLPIALSIVGFTATAIGSLLLQVLVKIVSFRSLLAGHSSEPLAQSTPADIARPRGHQGSRLSRPTPSDGKL